jgi:hypothetical protein
MTKYVITGVLKNGRRFEPIHTDTPWHYNIWMGTLWERLEEGKRKKVSDIIEGGFVGVNRKR